jgi:hypothetical protein
VNFNSEYLETYKSLLATTELQLGYQEFIKLFRFLRIELEKELPDFSFSGNIIENNMDFAYFQITDKDLREKGVKIQVVFVHKSFRFEVWASGYSRKIQCSYYNKLKNQPLKYYLNDNPERIDYIFKAEIEKDIQLHSGDLVISKIKPVVLEMIIFVKNHMGNVL